MNFTVSFSQGLTFAFEGKPSAAVRDCLKAHGLRWFPASKTWHRHYAAGGAEVSAEIQRLIDRESGVKRPDGDCWVCGNPDGYLRNRGAAAPVWCDACNQKMLSAEKSRKLEARALDVDSLYEDDCARRCGL